MTRARKTLISLQDSPYYHLVGRCVRRAWLWGIDQYSGRDYSHRKAWVLERMTELAEVFTIDVCAYAIMANHYHVVVHVDRARAAQLSSREVIARWCRLYARPKLIQKWEEGSCGPAERDAAEATIQRWRTRLSDVSWYMRCLNEYLARRANSEDQCTGRLWEGRFKSQALLDEAGLLTAMVYVDLNPIRADIARSPEESDFTSIYERIRLLRTHSSDDSIRASKAPPLMSFASEAADGRAAIPFALRDYLELVDWTGRARLVDKVGAIQSTLPPIMRRLGIDAAAWQAAMRPKGNVFGRALGRLDHLRLHASTLCQSWVRGLAQADRLYRLYRRG